MITKKEMISSLGSKWVEVTPDDVKSLGGDKFSTENECTKALEGVVTGDEFGSLVDDTYTSNRFMTAKSSSTEELDGRKVLKIEVGLDEQTAKNFVQKMGQSNLVKNILDKCRDELGSLDSSAEDAESNIENGKLTVWADRGKKQMVKLEASGDVVEDGETSSFGVVIEPGKGDVSIEEIGDDEKVNIKDLLSAFGVNSEMVQSLLQQGESEL